MLTSILRLHFLSISAHDHLITPNTSDTKRGEGKGVYI